MVILLWTWVEFVIIYSVARLNQRAITLYVIIEKRKSPSADKGFRINYAELEIRNDLQ